MSTRCQVQVIQEGLDWEEKVTLYHHTDGYPEYMIPTIKKAYDYDCETWVKGRAGKVASILCWADPAVFEPEEGHDLHGDIEYYYRLYLRNTNGGTLAEEATWELDVYEVDDESDYSKPLTIDNFKKINDRIPI